MAQTSQPVKRQIFSRSRGELLTHFRNMLAKFEGGGLHMKEKE